MNTTKIKHDYEVWPCGNIPQPNCVFYPQGRCVWSRGAPMDVVLIIRCIINVT